MLIENQYIADALIYLSMEYSGALYSSNENNTQI